MARSGVTKSFNGYGADSSFSHEIWYTISEAKQVTAHYVCMKRKNEPILMTKISLKLNDSTALKSTVLTKRWPRRNKKLKKRWKISCRRPICYSAVTEDLHRGLVCFPGPDCQHSSRHRLTRVSYWRLLMFIIWKAVDFSGCTVFHIALARQLCNSRVWHHEVEDL